MGSSLGVIVGLVVLLLCIGLVVLMVVSEWSAPLSAEGRSAPSPSVRGARTAQSEAKKKAAPKAKKRKK